ncbi:hypothetical protein LOZ61_000785 [Ophidiomyces ophidiicola]|uniref:Uncharacterized protein n=1 Tax=Ophidiomyces ophidiicola TaxID=1387563 RepID=A0ACB8USN9_9EURO|nr:uncharacterized protein LOZ57_001102 [Ophidiomyces ophidiicola]KAI1916883.1 hypothetical protein LOZ61_000785 [Ophidiomyces ophidiicola]KAI1917044.1 hypothetical protein LOZ64_003195 [Ophidiomyces ophidiicola]KAI1926759.1 hypothetical protein LOZ60_003462 [Ophidiomyces ophidiicola]KAI1951691.1 hypothetical protein LOZ57_001102 [Ophidiomyces ophidiicola]KAI1954619.1 hypothetical protein LOZ59_004821 [Ophidiomyces ophidiicola]
MLSSLVFLDGLRIPIVIRLEMVLEHRGENQYLMMDEESPLLDEQNAPNQQATRNKQQTKNEDERPGFLGVAALLLGAFVAGGDESMVISTYGSIASDLHQLSRGPWLVTGYTLGYCVALPIYGRLSDTGTATSITQAIFGRVFMGLGSAGMMALISIIITDLAGIQQIALYRSYVNVVSITGRSLGPALGGYLVDTVGWRWSFLGQIPLATVCAILAAYYIPICTSFPPDVEGEISKNSNPSLSSTLRRIDFAGLFFLTLSLSILLWVLDVAGRKLYCDVYDLLRFLACVVVFIVFLFIEAYWAKEPLTPIWMIGQNGIGFLFLVQILLSWGRLSTLTHLASFYIRTKDTSNVVASTYIVPSSIGTALGGLVSGVIISRTKTYKTLSIGSLALGCLAYIVIALRWVHKTSAWEALYVFPAGLSFGLVLSAQFVWLLANAPKSHISTAVSSYYLCQEVGMVLGVGTSTLLMQQDFYRRLFRSLEGVPHREEIIQGILEDMHFSRSLPEKIQAVVRSEYSQSFQLMPTVPIVMHLREKPLA